jgi:hypothetical protein
LGTARTRLRNLSALLGGALLVSMPATAASAATPGPTVAISNLSSGQTVSGQVTVDATVQAPAGATVGSVTFLLDGPGVEESQTVTPQAGQCDSTCTLSWTANTAAVRTYGAIAMPVPVFQDGSTYDITATVSSTAGTASSHYVPVVVDNHRPTLAAAPSSRTNGRWLIGLGDQSASFGATASVSPTAAPGTTVSDVEFEVPGDPGMPALQFTRTGDGSAWTATEDTSALAVGNYEGAIVATDSNGAVSAPLDAELVVDHGFTITPPAGGVIGPNWASSDFSFAYPGEWPCGNPYMDLGPQQVQLLVDGTLWGSSDLTGISPSAGCTMPLDGDRPNGRTPLPFGHHVLTYVVTDQAGLQQTASQDVTVALPLATTWPTAPMAVAEGSTLHLTPAVSAPDGFSKLQSWTIAYNGTTLASGSYPTQPSLTWATPTKNLFSGVLTLTTVSDSGLSTSTPFTITGEWATGTFLAPSASAVARGAWVKLTASTWQHTDGVWSNANRIAARVGLQWYVANSSGWSNGSSVAISPTAPGPAGVWVRVEQSECFQAVWTPTTPDTFLPSTSATHCVTVEP